MNRTSSARHGAGTIEFSLSQKKVSGVSLFSLLELILEADVSERVQAIIRARFGLNGQEPKTLEYIGKTYDITRERVRQIIVGAVRDLSTQKNTDVFDRVRQKVVSTIEMHHGIMTEEALYAELSEGNVQERGALRFFVENFVSLQVVRETQDIRSAFAVPGFSLNHWKKMIEKVSEILTLDKRPLSDHELRDAVQSDAKFREVTDCLFDYLLVSKRIKQSVFGLWGFSNWSDIEPKGAREKAYLVLKAEQQPLHFREIAALIDKYSLQKRGRVTHYQTVHNELIKDKRFVLVGRGIYALAEWGYKRGTVREILTDILSVAEKPLNREEVLERVAEIRQVKRSTVVINLNTFFKRVGKDGYTIKNK